MIQETSLMCWLSPWYISLLLARSGESKTFSILSGRSWGHIPLCLPIEKTPSDSLLASWQYQSHPGFLLEGTIRIGRWRQSHANRGLARAQFFFVLLRCGSINATLAYWCPPQSVRHIFEIPLLIAEYISNVPYVSGRLGRCFSMQFCLLLHSFFAPTWIPHYIQRYLYADFFHIWLGLRLSIIYCL